MNEQMKHVTVGLGHRSMGRSRLWTDRQKEAGGRHDEPAGFVQVPPFFVR